MIIWRGKGILVIVAFVLGAALTSPVIYLFSKFTTDELLMQRISLFLIPFGGAVVNYFFSKWFISTEERVLIDQETGRQIIVKDRSSLFFVPNKYWSYILLILGLLISLTIQ